MLILHPHVAALDMEAFFAPAAVTWSFGTEVQPDIMVVRRIQGRRIERFDEVRDLELAVEVLSPSTIRTDRFTKRRLYQHHGVAEYWIVDAAGRSVERWRPNDAEPEIVLETLHWEPAGSAAPLAVDLVTYFRRVHGD
jgi:Uma2 family endonuclease